MSAARSLKHGVRMDETLVAWCQEAVEATFSSLFSDKPELKWSSNDKTARRGYQVSGVVGFIQDRFEGTMALGFEEETVIKLMSRFYMEPVTLTDERLIGGVSEMTNIIFGVLKEKFNVHGYRFGMCLPVFIVGDNHSIFSTLESEKLALEFSSVDGPFWLEISAIEGFQRQKSEGVD